LLGLAEAQAAMRTAIVDGDAADVLPRLIGGRDPRYRLSIHQRHYEASIADVLRRRFPTIEWIVGAPFLARAAKDFARHRPPSRPALGEYGAEFPNFLASQPGVEAMPWIVDLGALEWRLAEVAAQIELPALSLDAFAAFAEHPLDELGLRLQPGAAYFNSAWPVDDLVRFCLDGNAPERLDFQATPIWLELVGARGSFTMRRLDRGVYGFRAAIADGTSLAPAIGCVAGTDQGAAFAGLFADGLVTRIETLARGVPE
jgi:hypothetical protein